MLVTRLATAVSSRKTPKMAINRDFPGLRAFSANVARDKNEEQEIPLPSAVHLEERLTVSHSVPAPGQQSVRRKLAVWVFSQWQMRAQAVGRRTTTEQAVAEWQCSRSQPLVGGSNPSLLTLMPPPPPPPKVSRSGFEPPPRNCALAALPLDRRRCDGAQLPHCL